MAIVTRLLASFLLDRDLSQSQLNHGFFNLFSLLQAEQCLRSQLYWNFIPVPFI